MNVIKSALFFLALASQANASFALLDRHIQQKVFFSTGVLSAQDLCRCARVSKGVRVVADSDAAWRHVLGEDREAMIRYVIARGTEQSIPDYYVNIRILYKEMMRESTFVSIKMLCRFYAVLPSSKFLVAAEIDRLSLWSKLKFFNREGELADELKSYVIPNIRILEELYLFAEKFDCRHMYQYISDIDEGMLKSIRASSPLKDKKKCFSDLFKIHNRLISMGSNAAKDRKDYLKTLMRNHRVELGPDECFE